MQQHSKLRSVILHLYPGIFITLFFVLVTPWLVDKGYPPQFSMLLAILLVVVPLLAGHLFWERKQENKTRFQELIGLRNRLSAGRLILYVLGLVVWAFLVWGITQPLDLWITKNLFSWLPDWYTVYDFKGYPKDKIVLTLGLNLVLNGLLAPVVEELYFRGFLLPRMEAFGKLAPVANAVLFSLYHLWQPYVYITLIIALIPMVYVTWKTGDWRVSLFTHGLLNLVGAVLGLLAAVGG